MYLGNYQYLKNKETNLLIFLFIFSLLIRIPVILIFGDLNLENEWAVLVHNLIENEKLSRINFGNFFVPSIFMPPLYAFYLYFFKLLNLNNDIYIQLVLFSQVILSSISVLIFYVINKNFFSKKISFFGAFIFSIVPLHIYACGQISSIILQSFLTITFFYFFLRITKKIFFINIFFWSMTSGLLILLRGEFIAFFILSLLYLFLFFKVKIKNLIIMLILTILVVSPYLTRNIQLLDTATITKSIGWNLWKGNHANTKVQGNAYYDDNPILIEKINKIPKDKYYEINMDKVFLHEGLKNIKNDPFKYFILYLKKIFSFIFIDVKSTLPHYYNPLHYMPVLIIGITSVIGIYLYKKKSHQFNFLILFFIIQVAIVSIFFILPRYKLGILPLQIIFSNVFFEYINNNFLKKK